jgi:hypothetical protein
MHQRVGDQHDPPLVQQRGHTHRAILAPGVEHVVYQFQHMRRFARRPGDQPIAMPMRQHQRREHVPVARGKAVNILPVMAPALQPLVEKLL